MAKKKTPANQKTDAAAAGMGALNKLTGGFTKSNGLDWVKSLAIAIGLALLIRWSIAEPFRIPSGSMEPTLHGDDRMFHGDRVFVNKFVYGWRWPLNKVWIPFTNIPLHYADKRLWRRHDPQRWDIVVFKAVGEGARHNTLVKRIVGLPGERIHIKDGKVYANGVALEPPKTGPNAVPKDLYYTSDDLRMAYGVLPDDKYSVVPPDHYLALGDNSAQSLDGRYWGWLPNENILGRVSCIWWPPSRWRDFTGFSQTVWWRALVAVLGVLAFLRLFFFRLWRMAFKDMDGKERADHVVINRWAYGLPVPFTHMKLSSWGAPKRGDLVLYRVNNPTSDQPPMLIGRIAGVQGERVFIDGGKLTINGSPVAEWPFAVREFVSGEGVGPYGRSKGKDVSEVPAGHVFILTETTEEEDNLDSRTLGWIPVENLVGRVAARWWPPKRSGE